MTRQLKVLKTNILINLVLNGNYMKKCTSALYMCLQPENWV